MKYEKSVVIEARNVKKSVEFHRKWLQAIEKDQVTYAVP